jgi:PAS domain S-box-containing protein
MGNLLLVDDDPVIRELFCRYLTDIGYRVEVAASGEEALTKAAQFPIQVALVDLRLPGMDGLSVIRCLKREYPEVQTVIVSGVGELEDAIEAIKEKVCYYLRKSPELTELGQTVRLAMDRFELQRRNRIYQMELEASERELRAQKAFTEQIIENVNLFVVGCDQNRQINLFNRLAERISGYSKDEVIEREISIIFPDPPQGNGLPFLRSTHGVGSMNPPRRTGQTPTFEFPIRTRSGHIIDFLWTESHVNGCGCSVDDSGSATGWIGFGEDLTEKKALERKLIRSEKLAAIGRLSAAIAHEINNPLQGIKSNFNLIASHLKDDFDETFRIALVSEGLNRIAAFVHRLLDVHRPRSSDIREVDLPTLINGVCALVEPSCEKECIRIERKWQSETGVIPVFLPVRGSSSDLHQVFLNLALNAIEAMHGCSTEQHERRISFEIVQNDESTAVLVSDTGQGIAPEALEFIFEPFFTTKKDSRFESTGKGVGLGLSIVRGILDTIEGDIEVAKTGSEGTCFEVRLPTIQKMAKVNESNA